MSTRIEALAWSNVTIATFCYVYLLVRFFAQASHRVQGNKLLTQHHRLWYFSYTTTAIIWLSLYSAAVFFAMTQLMWGAVVLAISLVPWFALQNLSGNNLGCRCCAHGHVEPHDEAMRKRYGQAACCTPPAAEVVTFWPWIPVWDFLIFAVCYITPLARVV